MRRKGGYSVTWMYHVGATMDDTYTLIIEDRALTDFFREAVARVADPGPMMREMGDTLVQSTKERFGAGTGPDGVKWPGNAQSTLDRWLGLAKSSYKKDGSVSKAGAARAASKKPLVGQTKNLMGNITFQIEGNALVWGSPEKYAAVQQWGAAQGAFGRDRRNHPIPWGDIPARPYLGLSAADREMLLGIMGRFMLPV